MNKVFSFFKKFDFLYYWGLLIPVAFILWGSLGEGFMFTMDSQFTPNYNVFNLDLNYDLGIVKYFLYYLSRVIDPKILQILYFAICLYVPAFLGFMYLKNYVSKTAAFIASFFLIINPFVYERLVAGHIHLIFVIGLIIPYIHFLITKKDKLRNYMLLLIPLLGSVISPHLIWYLLVPILLNTLISIKNKKIDLIPIGYLGVIALGEFLIINSKSIDKSTDLISQFFTTSIFSMFVFEGMWTEKEKLVETIFSINLASVFIWSTFYVIAFLGLKKGLSNKNSKFILILISSGLIGLLFTGLSIKEFQEIYSKFFIVPGFAVMREGQKWLALYLIGFIGVFSVGIDYFMEKFPDKKVFLFIFFIVLVILSSYKIFFLGNGQIKRSDYPENWRILENMAKKDLNSKILVLPWSGYSEFKFLDNTYIADPSKLYFSNKVISARFPENMNYLNKCDIQDLNFCINFEDSKEAWNEFIMENNIKFIIINKTKDDDFETNEFSDKLDYEIKLDDLNSEIYVLNK